MGDLNAVDYAQTGHMNILREAGGLRDETLLRYRAPVPRGHVWEGVVVDDRVLLRQEPRAAARGAPRSRSAPPASRPTERCVHEPIDDVYERAGLAAKRSKRVRDAHVAEFWGAHVSGHVGFVRAKDEIMHRTVALTMALLQLGVATASLWEAAVGL